MEFVVPEVVRFRVETREGLQMVVTRKDGGPDWDMEAPYQAEGDTARLSGALVRLKTLKPSRVLDESAGSLAPFGLDDPSLTVHVELKDGSVESLAVGDRTATQTSYYARRGTEQEVLLVESAMVNQLHTLIASPPEQPTPLPTPT